MRKTAGSGRAGHPLTLWGWAPRLSPAEARRTGRGPLQWPCLPNFSLPADASSPRGMCSAFGISIFPGGPVHLPAAKRDADARSHRTRRQGRTSNHTVTRCGDQETCPQKKGESPSFSRLASFSSHKLAPSLLHPRPVFAGPVCSSSTAPAEASTAPFPSSTAAQLLAQGMAGGVRGKRPC